MIRSCTKNQRAISQSWLSAGGIGYGARQLSADGIGYDAKQQYRYYQMLFFDAAVA